MSSLKRDSSGNYVVRFRVGGRGSEWIRRNLGPVSHTDAKRLGRELEAKLKTTRPGARPFLTFGELADMYLEERAPRLTGRGYKTAEMIVAFHLKPFFGARRVMDLRAADVESYREQRRCHVGKKVKHATERPIAAGTFNREWTVFQAILNFGERTERIERNPIRHGAVEKLATKAREAFFEPGEWGTFIRAAAPDPELRAAVPILRAKLLLAARLSEIVDLRWKDVDLERKLVTVRQPKTTRKGQASKVLPIAPELDTLLRTQVRGFGEAFVFTRYNAKPWRGSDLQSAFERILRASKIEPLHGRVTPHSIRHTAATWTASAGFGVRVPALLGHTAKGTTAGYIHAQDLAPAVHALAALEAGAVAGVTSVCSGDGTSQKAGA